nr:ATP-binding cassette domain-containing protein [Marinicella sp. W31]MDC2880260.1 ATP-binding cassette domain-containing protein [Marinicella sp. W31]
MLLSIKALEKRFSGTRALDGAYLDVGAGSVHGLLGENGAGKSTLIKTLSGLLKPDAGEILIDGKPVTIENVHHAETLGFRFIHQELSLVPHFNAVENAFVGRHYPKRGPFIDRRAMAEKIAETARDIAPDLPLDVPAARLTTGQKQLVEIIRALIGEPARLVVMDEADGFAFGRRGAAALQGSRTAFRAWRRRDLHFPPTGRGCGNLRPLHRSQKRRNRRFRRNLRDRPRRAGSADVGAR